MRIRTLFAALIAVVALTWLAGGAHSGEGTEARPVTVVLLRHAEAEPSSAEARDPDLTERGRERAGALTRLLSEAGATRFFASEFARTQQTLAGLASANGGELEIVSARSPEEQIDTLRGLEAGTLAVVAGHSNTIPRLVEALGGECRDLVDQPPYGEILPHDAFDRLYVLTLPAAPDGATSTIELRYGAE